MRLTSAVVLEAATAGALVGALALAASAQDIDVRVNAYTTSGQGRASVAADADENFVVVWESYGQDGSGTGVFARRFDASGQPVGPDFQVNTYTTGTQWLPRMAMRSEGEFVVVWQRLDGSFSGVFARLFEADGDPLGPEFRVNSYTTDVQRFPVVAMGESGRFVVAWEAYALGGIWDVRARQFDASGNPLGSDFAVNTYSTGRQRPASVGMDGSDNFVVAWHSGQLDDRGNSPCASWEVLARRFDASAMALGPDFRLSTGTTAEQNGAEVHVLEDGSFATTWFEQYCGNRRLTGLRFDASGAPMGPPFPFDTALPGLNEDGRASVTDVVMDEEGQFVVAWNVSTYFYVDEYTYGFYDHHIRTRRFDASGNPIGRPSVANTAWEPDDLVTDGTLAAARPGRFIVAWMGPDADGSGVLARSPDVIFTDAFETGDLAAWSAGSTHSDLTVSSAARMGGSPADGYGLRVTVDDQTSLSVQDDTPTAEPRYRARFYLDPNGFDPGESVGKFRQHIFLAFSEAPLKRLVLIMLRRIGGQYAIGAHVRRDDDTLAKSAFAAITDGPHAIEFDWQKASAPGTNDGRFELWIDGTSAVTLTGLDNDARPVDFVRMGALSVKAGAAGTLYFDEFVSRRLAYIGP